MYFLSFSVFRFCCSELKENMVDFFFFLTGFRETSESIGSLLIGYLFTSMLIPVTPNVSLRLNMLGFSILNCLINAS